MNKQLTNTWIAIAVIGSLALFLFAISFVGFGGSSTPAQALPPTQPAGSIPVPKPSQPQIASDNAAAKPAAPAQPAAPAAASGATGALITSPSGLQYLDEKVAMLHLAKLGVELETLRQDQAEYIGVEVHGSGTGDTSGQIQVCK